uniref:Carbohydrate-binding domain-containing protein n=1 Tax=Chromera velia CCMP2878 TaxID=1169474 RepID=A0A0G4I7P1_9ALVE|eukprot:Cvel_11736.t1-p1 / transcript=Cvel_11736.t1 / gene=Cvel_11736 / organism=Chromera_velia_CCMP2878 / gene_product=hypothetical protein / transcript_product=hypothetical protein / location=Cvel_scaffold745:54666-60196(+) / protein_length=400 / sequence_SO=supercontig / SO=protein_coding / is_pseudo=false
MKIGSAAWHGERVKWWQAMEPLRPKVYVCPLVNPSALPTAEWDVRSAAWEHAPWTDDFVDILNTPPGVRPWYRTRMKMLWEDGESEGGGGSKEDGALWVGAWMEEPEVFATCTERNQFIWQHDNDFEIFLSPEGGNHNYYEYEVNALGVPFELHLDMPYSDHGHATHGTNLPNLEARVQIEGGRLNFRTVPPAVGWSLVVRVPFRDLQDLLKERDSKAWPQRGTFWRVNFSRVQWQLDADPVTGALSKKPGLPEDNWVWSPQGIVNMHRPERWGFLIFGEHPKGPGEVEIPDRFFSIKEYLMKVYHYQTDFKKANGKWATNIEEDLGVPMPEGIIQRVEFQNGRESAPEGFLLRAWPSASLGSAAGEKGEAPEVPTSDFSPSTCVCTREDGLLWVEEGAG